MGGFVFVFVTPDFVQDLVVGQHPTGVFHQMVEQTVFGRAKLNEFAFDPNFMTIKVNREAVVNDDFPDSSSLLAALRRKTARMRLVSSRG